MGLKRRDRERKKEIEKIKRERERNTEKVIERGTERERKSKK